MSLDLDAALAVAVEAALAAGKIMRECYEIRFAAQAAGAGVDLAIDEKSAPTDLVTKYDKMCDEAIIGILTRHNAALPEAAQFHFITEELCPDAPLTDAPTWIVDPIDGTMAFVHQSFDCCVSIGLAVDKKPVLGVVYCPFVGGVAPASGDSAAALLGVPVSPCFPSRGELFTAVSGRGTFLNGKRVVVDNAPRSKSVALFNLPWRATKSALDAGVAIRRELSQSQFHAIRAYGACVFQLAQVAAGRAGLIMEPASLAWDVCAGAVLVVEAGGTVLALEGNAFTLAEHTVAAGASKELAEFGGGLCKKFSYREAHSASE